MPNLYEKFDFGVIFDFLDFQKGICLDNLFRKVSTFVVIFPGVDVFVATLFSTKP